ncbi:hypothetical protein SCLCIDRAFT_1214951 [Scleroderma citrinum Foug A]|uniref:Uncharacterized protein n=1 Tax=Scleroderma citrinum Foug A TaxID=1036808 RepID=A0A0C2ZM36_9AGAM|nr:hypothetical protein SCLCIDRAFT_1214951 [Scleroderma citrinum Foug A]
MASLLLISRWNILTSHSLRVPDSSDAELVSTVDVNWSVMAIARDDFNARHSDGISSREATCSSKHGKVRGRSLSTVSRQGRLGL